MVGSMYLWSSTAIRACHSTKLRLPSAKHYYCCIFAAKIDDYIAERYHLRCLHLILCIRGNDKNATRNCGSSCNYTRPKIDGSSNCVTDVTDLGTRYHCQLTALQYARTKNSPSQVPPNYLNCSQSPHLPGVIAQTSSNGTRLPRSPCNRIPQFQRQNPTSTDGRAIQIKGVQ